MSTFFFDTQSMNTFTGFDVQFFQSISLLLFFFFLLIIINCYKDVGDVSEKRVVVITVAVASLS